MSSNHGRQERGLVGGNIQIGGKTVVDAERNAHFKTLSTGVEVASAGNLVAGDSLVGGVEVITASGGSSYELNPAKLLSAIINSSGANTGTLGEGVSGQLKTVVAASVTGSFVLTPGSFNNGTTITFDATGESATLIWAAGAWHVLALNGATVA